MLARTQKFRAGMPHLDIFGLSEQFCLSHAGNMHWSWISEFTKNLPSDWQSEDGRRAYASFIYTSITYGRDVETTEDDEIIVECRPLGLRAPFFLSETTYSKPGHGVAACVLLMSTFSATDGPSNRSFIKSSVPFHTDPFGVSLVDETRAKFREMRDRDDGELTHASDHLVNPSVDFNAADFMYFANYCQLFKRYEAPWLSASSPLQFREISYFGNVDAFEKTSIASHRDGMKVHAAMTRSSDHRCIARSYSRCVSNVSAVSVETKAPVDLDARQETAA